MMYPRSEILFPHRCVASLKHMRGPEWRALVDRIAELPDTHMDSLAFALMMIKLTGCLNCDLDSYKASLGCCTCAKRAINAFKGSDKVLLTKFAEAQRELEQYWAEHEATLGPRGDLSHS
ncbi:MAG: hypothetical protein JXA09_14310 [Anaerolineae bacterium]|nr:hypothetical protein [Anaerolineae bacterium]